MAHLSKRVLAIAMLVLAAVTSVKANPKHTSTPTWCVARHNTNKEALEKLVNSLCGTQGVDCSAIQPDGPCYYPNTYYHHASYAMNYHFHVKGGDPENCVYNGHGQIVHKFPQNNGGCYYHPHDHHNHQNHQSHHQGESHQNHQSHHQGQNHHSTTSHQSKNAMDHWYCVANSNANADALQKVIDELCAKINCAPIKPGGDCYEPNDHHNHASFAMNSYFQIRGRKKDDCHHGGLGHLTTKNPDYKKCTYLRGNEGNTHPEL